MTQPKVDARRALLESFAQLAVTRRYQDIGVGQIIGMAQVARSTFYYHFKAKDELLILNLTPLFRALAGLAAETGPTQDVRNWLRHIWENRSRARRLFEGATGRRIAAALVLELNAELAAIETDAAHLRPLVAEQIAGSMLGVLRAWVAGSPSATPDDIAELLWTGARSIAGASRRLPEP